MKPKANKTRIARTFLQLLYISFLGYHAGFSLHFHFGFSIVDTLLIISVVELSVVLIDWTGLKSFLLWLIKTGLLFCSVFFSLYGFVADYNKQANTLIEISKSQFIASNDTYISDLNLDIQLLNSKIINLDKEIQKYVLLGEQTIGTFTQGAKKGQPYFAADVVRWKTYEKQKLLSKSNDLKKQINELKRQDEQTKIDQKKNLKEMEKQKNLLFIVKLKNYALSFLVCFIALINMFISSITEKIEKNIETAVKNRSRKKRNSLRFQLDPDEDKETKRSFPFSSSFDLSFLRTYRNKASPF